MSRHLLNLWWCTHHWQPYETDEPAGRLATVAMAQALTQRSDFKHVVQHRQAAYQVGMGRAIHAVIEDWVGRADKPVCCLLGDALMANIEDLAKFDVSIALAGQA